MSLAGTLDAEHPHGPLKPPGDTTGLFGVFRRRYLLSLLVRKEVRVRYQASVLGMAWSYIKPLVRFLTYVVIVGYVIGLKDLENYPLHVFCGMMIVHFFTETLSAGTKSVVKNKSLVNKMNVPREMFPVASLLVTTYHMFPQYVILLIGCVLIGWSPGPAALAAGVLSLLLVATFSLAVGLAFSALNVLYRDVQNFTETIQLLVRWTTPMIYPFELVASRTNGNWLEQLYLANPVAIAVMLAQRCFWVPTLDHPREVVLPSHLMIRGLIMVAISLVLVYIAQKLFSRLEGRFAEQML
ncbi:MAG TPA: ABC transporter permease [Nocardioidaceae bacterium]|nr:ABC transporter permease [Nocardioidaceae bacterium]